MKREATETNMVHLATTFNQMFGIMLALIAVTCLVMKLGDWLGEKTQSEDV